MRKYLVSIGLLLLVTIKSNSQLNISGFVTDSLNKPIANASITLQKNNSNFIIAFTATNSKGFYNIQYLQFNNNDSFYLKANCIDFIAKTVKLQQTTATVNFRLIATSYNLPNVTVNNKKPFLKYKADTLTYAVDSFVQAQDRTIGDVLRKMPGIELDASGKIFYNGKAISNFYIDGDNLLDDKYNIATKSISADMVKDVQVLENHQPIKVLKDATISDKVGINLNLKNKARLAIQTRAEVGVGYSNSALYDATINIMAFKKKYKAINSFKSNNVGVEIGNDVVSHNIADLQNFLNNQTPNSLLSLNYPSNPNISQQRYLFNNAALANTNNLFKTKNEVQIKTNIYILYDKQYQTFTNKSTFYLPTDTIQFLQYQNTQNKYNVIYAQVGITSNKDKKYLNNKTIAEVNSLPSFSNTSFNGKQIIQNLSQKTTSISNELNIIKSIKAKSVLEIFSYINFVNKPEILQINPGITTTIINNGYPYNQLLQQNNTPTLFTNNYINFRKPSKKILQSYKLGLTSTWQQLNSQARIISSNNVSLNLSDSFNNKLTWNQQKIYSTASYDYKGERTNISLVIPLSYQQISYSNYYSKLLPQTQFNQFIVTPNVQIKYALANDKFFVAKYTFGNNVSNVQDAFEGMIINNLNQITTNNIAIKQTNIHLASLLFNYRKTIKVFFWNIGINYNKANNNNIIETDFLRNIQIQKFIPFNNETQNLTMFTSASKYLFNLHTTLNIKSSFKISVFNQLQNGLLQQFTNQSNNISIGIAPQINKWLNISYNGSFTKLNSKINNLATGKQSVTQMQHSFEANIFAGKKLFFKLKADNFYVKQSFINNANNYFFVDAAVKFKANKLKTDFVLDCINLANTKEYSIINVNANNVIENSFLIRPRMIIVKAFFNF